MTPRRPLEGVRRNVIGSSTHTPASLKTSPKLISRESASSKKKTSINLRSCRRPAPAEQPYGRRVSIARCEAYCQSLPPSGLNASAWAGESTTNLIPSSTGSARSPYLWPFRQPQPFGVPFEPFSEKGLCPAYLGKLVAPRSQRHDDMVIHLTDRVAVFVKTPGTFAVGLQDTACRFRVLGFKPVEKRGPELKLRPA